MNPMTRILLTVFVVITAVIGAGVYFSSQDGGTAGAGGTQGDGEAQVVRENSHRLSSPPDSDVTFVEFLDFECEGCGAAFPAVEQLRAQYGQQVTFVARYFPMPGHFNGERAARAVEAAAQQGQFEPMYKKMFETQSQWGEQQVPADEVFRGYATELGQGRHRRRHRPRRAGHAYLLRQREAVRYQNLRRPGRCDTKRSRPAKVDSAWQDPTPVRHIRP